MGKGVNVMKTKMDVKIKVTPRNIVDLLATDLSHLDTIVTELGGVIYVNAQIDLREDTIEKIIEICKKYGDCKLEAYLSD